MNHLAKHFFEYQSYINLPHHALQMHKTPPSQAGSDPSAAWAPKDLHMAGKNQAAPAARAARNYHGDQRTGSHRHGRPSKLEFRSWGERHGELRAEKIVPHQEHMLHRHMDIDLAAPQRRHTASGGIDHFPSEYFPARHFLLQRHGGGANTAEQQQQQTKRASVLVILTMAPHLDFVTVTVKSIRSTIGMEKIPSVKLCFFDGSSLVEERVTGRKKGDQQSTSSRYTAPKTKSNAIDEIGIDDGLNEFEIGESFLLRVPSPLRLPFCHIILTFYAADSQQIIGFCQLGPTGSISRGTIQWRQMIKKLGNGHRSPPPPPSDERRHTVPRRRTTVSVPPLTVGTLKALTAAAQQRLRNESKGHHNNATSGKECAPIRA
ncbi:hypothetical protein niasHS_011286 [Heterodera schachtii]|uniref:Uncharacterized protein n=1 Tax=Heterodera schachtii TaxID=97005 RepID=A0ABD2IU26_HETSC